MPENKLWAIELSVGPAGVAQTIFRRENQWHRTYTPSAKSCRRLEKLVQDMMMTPHPSRFNARSIEATELFFSDIFMTFVVYLAPAVDA